MNDKDIFEKTVKENKDTIYTVCYMFSNDEQDVADLFQETLINIWKGLGRKERAESLANGGNTRGWIYRIALNTCISHERKRRRHRTEPLSLNASLFDDAREQRERNAELLHRRITRLQPFYRAIVLLWLEDISYEEIGQILGISTKNVSVRLFRIREQLKAMSDKG